MEDKKAAEAFRLQQHAGTHPAHGVQSINPSTAPLNQLASPLIHQSPPPDSDRIIVHFDVDCFYAQCEELRDPSLRELPLGVTQKFLLVTCNYVSRDRGITKLMSIKEAQQKCPELVLINGEDLTPYRHASKSIISVLKRYGTVQKLGLDEFFVDITSAVNERLRQQQQQQQHQQSNTASTSWTSNNRGAEIEYSGHVHVPGELHQDNKYRPMDLRATTTTSAHSTTYTTSAAWWPRLAIGSLIAHEARHAVKVETGLRTSAGISCNKLLSKLSSGLHKPDAQTLLLPSVASSFLKPLPVRALPGVGVKLEAELIALGVDTVGSLRKFTEKQLIEKFGEKTGTFLALARWGLDDSEVVEQGPPKSITVEDSFRSCRGYPAAKQVLQVLAPDLISRLKEDAEEHNRRPSKLILKWRTKGNGWNRTSASCNFPVAALIQAEGLERVAGQLLASNVKEPFDLTLISIGGTGFVENSGPTGRSTERSIADMLQGHRGGSGSLQQQAAAAVEKDLPASSYVSPAAVAGLSLKRRRDYGTGTDNAPLSKHAERMLRQGDGSGGSDFAVNGAAPLPPPPLNGRSEYIDDDTYNEDMDDDLWDDLAGLHDPSHPAAKQQRSRNNRKRVVVTGAGGINYTNHHTNTLSAGAAPSTTSIPTIPTATDRNPTDNKHVSCSQPRVIIHCDIDSFYCSVERLDDPTLRNLPLAVEQFNSGGFVAVSYEARAAGIRCGDGAGAAGRAVIPHLAAMKARSIEECRIACPGLVIRGMRPQRYREVGRAIQEMLKSLVGSTTTMVPVEKASCDDFYLDVTALCSSSDNAFIDTLNLKEQQLGLSSSFSNILERFPDGLKFIYLQKKNEDADNKKSAAVWSTVSPDLQRGVYIAHAIRQTLSQKLGLTASCAVSRNKLISRLASPTNKPNGLTLVASDAAAVDFIGDIPIKSVPSMQRKLGTEVQEALGDIKLVKDLVKFEKKDLEAKFGPARGKFLSNLPAAIDTTPVAERGPPKSITSERSFPPAKNQDAVLIQIKTLVEQLLLRGALDVAEHSRLPSKLGIGFRLGYDTNLISRSGAVPLKVLTWLRSSITSSANTTPPAGEVVDAAADAVLILLRGAANGRWDITRAAVVLHYGDVGNSRSEHTGPTIGELFKATVAEKDSSKKEEIKKHENAAGPSSKEPQKQIPSTYRNAEALALQAIFSGSGSGGGGDNNNQSIPSILKNNKDNDDDLDKASLELALKLQREEAGVVDLSSNRIKTSSSKKKNARGPLDNFFIIPKPKP